jgi:Uncharacterised protein family (UPF0014)
MTHAPLLQNLSKLHCVFAVDAISVVLLDCNRSRKIRTYMHSCAMPLRAVCMLSCCVYTMLGYVLVPCFAHPSWELSLLIAGVMGMIAAREATARAKYSYAGMYCRVSAFEVLLSRSLCICQLLVCIPATCTMTAPWPVRLYVLLVLSSV